MTGIRHALRVHLWAFRADLRLWKDKPRPLADAPTPVVYDIATRVPFSPRDPLIREARAEARLRLGARHSELVRLLQLAGCSAPPEATAEVFKIVQAQRKLDNLDALVASEKAR